MKNRIFCIALLNAFVLFFFSCSNQTEADPKNHSLQKTEICSADQSVSYEVYLPATISKCKNFNLLVILDPHGSTTSVLERFKTIADDYHFLLTVSKNIKNGTQNYAEIINRMLDDIQQKYSAGKVVFLAGFSGGGRMALDYAEMFPVDGVVCCGALATKEHITAINAPVMCIAGMADFNFIESAQYIFNPEQAPPNLNLILTNDTHAWPSSNILKNAISILLLNIDENKLCSPVSKLISSITRDQITLFDSLYKTNDLIGAGLLARNLAKLKIPSLSDRLEMIEYSSDFNNELNKLRESIRFELAVRNAYYEAFFNENQTWWENEIASLNKNIIDDKDPYRNYALQRIKGFLGIMCYSLCDNSLHRNELIMAKKILMIYRTVEPENSDMLYYSALFEYKSNNYDRAGELLLKAYQAGFNDKELMQRDFPEEFIQMF
jgi:pimeloyl-ACP methyl ester carboxylesterase